MRRGAKDPVCRIRVDHYSARHTSVFEERTYYFCTAGCREELEILPEHYARHAHGGPRCHG
jgi:Cu+-exporting ATPase